jgi:hypothetical protein
MVSFLHSKKGMDYNFARQQSWWNQISQIVETDQKTMTKLVEHTFDTVAGAKVGELDWLAEVITAGTAPETILQAVAHRKAMIEHFAKERAA